MENTDPARKARINLSLRKKFTIQKRDTRSSKPEPDDSADNSKPFSFVGVEDSASTSSRGLSNGIILSENNDSLCDFRSPVKEELDKSLVDFRVKPTVLKPNKRLQARKESKPAPKKKRGNRDAVANHNQRSIESSFFKPQTPVKTAFVCPLCLKSYKDATTQHNHMKICAAKNKISTDKLLDAVELQEKQAREREAMGLLAAPTIQQKKTMSKKLISDKDPQLQLALALSMSLHEAQVTEEIEDAHLLAGEAFTPISSEMTEERRKTLQNFGFTTNKPLVASTSGRSRKKRPAGPTVLQNRTQEERDRLLTVRIAEVLMGDEAITQAMMNNVEKVIQSERNFVLKSRLLKSYHCLKDRLWDKTQKSLSPRSYSCNLLGLPLCSEKPEVEVKEPELEPSKFETPNPGMSNTPDAVVDVIDENIISAPTALEIAPKSSIVGNNKVRQVTCFTQQDTDRDSAIDLAKDWRCMVGSSYMSDVLIITKENHKINAHQIVFWTRCSSILGDVTSLDVTSLDPTEYPSFCQLKHKISWPETHYYAARGFLEFLYCGVIDQYKEIFNYPEDLAGVRALARKYKLKKLFTYLRDKSIELISKKTEEQQAGINSDDSSSRLGKDESSTSTLEIDTNSQSTVCHVVISNSRVIDERDCDCNNLGSRNLKPFNLPDETGKNMSHYSVIDCFSSSNDSLATHIPKASTSAKSIHEKFLDRMSQRIPRTVAAEIQNHGLNNQENDNNLKVLNRTFEDTRCISPDIFDDSTTLCSTFNNAVLEEPPCDTERDKNFSNADIEVVCTSGKNLLTQSPDLNKEIDKTADTSRQYNSEKPEKPTVDCTFISTRRRRRSFKLVSESNGSNLNAESDDSEEKKNVPGPSLRPKGDITMAIEKMQRLNAKTASESDSDCESMENFPMRRPRNPFRINASNTTSMIEEIKRVAADEPDDVPLKRRNKLSIFEQRIQLEAAKNPAMFNLTNFKPAADVDSQKKGSADALRHKAGSKKTEDLKLDQPQTEVDDEDRIEPSQRGLSKLADNVDEIFDLTQESSREKDEDSNDDTWNTTTEDQDLSMFSRYKKKHRHNSIDQYRAALKNLISSRASASVIEDTDDALSSDDSQSLNDLDTDETRNRKSFSSKYEYTSLNQSRSHFHKELSNISMKDDDKIEISDESLHSVKTDKDQGAMKPDDTELSDLEIDLSDISSARSLYKLDASKLTSQSQRTSTANRNSGLLVLDGEQVADGTRLGIDTFTDIKLEDTEFTIMKNNSKVKKTNISDQETDTECYIASVSHLNQAKNVAQITRRSDTDEEKSSDIYNEETDTGEMEDKDDQRKNSRSKINLDTVCKETPKSRPSMEDRHESFSPDCEFSGMFTSPSVAFDFVKNISNQVDNLLDECKISSQIFREAQASTSHSVESSFTPRIPRDDYLKDISLLKRASDLEFDNMNFIRNMDSPENQNWNNKSANVESFVVEKGEKPTSKDVERSYCILESDTSDSGDFKIHKKNSIASTSLANRSKVMRKRSKQSSRRSITPESGPTSSLRKFKVKSMSENIITTKPTSGVNLLDDSFDGEFCRVQTPPLGQNTSSNIVQVTPQQAATPENITPLANYSAMKSPELRNELRKYGLKAQKRHRAKQLLRYIYNELHPLVPVEAYNISAHSDGSSSEDGRPIPKRLNRSKSLGAINTRKNTDVESDCENLESDSKSVSDDWAGVEGLENYDSDTLSQSGDCESLENIFRNLITADKSLHNKILTYEPLVLEELHSTLKAQGLKCKLNALMDFLDEQCITFRTLASAKKNRTRRKESSKKNQGTQKAKK